MDRRALVLAAAASALPARAGAREPRLLLVHSPPGRAHRFAESAGLWTAALAAGRHGAPPPAEVTRLEQAADLARLAALLARGAAPVDAVCVYALWGPGHGGSLDADGRSALHRYVAGGGGLLVLHTGIASFEDWADWPRLTGARWRPGHSRHTPVKPLSVQVLDPDHPVTRGVPGLQIRDELFQRLGMVERPHLRLLASAMERGVPEPVAWVNPYGRGRVFTTTLGHGPEAWGDDGFQRLLTNALAWASTA